jgi:hypothetical protein
MIPISFDFTDLSEEFNLNYTQTANMMEFVTKQVTAEIARQWGQQAKTSLKKTRTQYLRGLVVVDKGRFEGQVVLKGVLPNMVESGITAFDMKDGFLKSGKVKNSKNGGRYITIPFRLGAPSSLGESSAFSDVMPAPVYQAAKVLPPKTGLSQTNVPAPFNELKTRAAINTTSKAFEAYKHKSSIYAGMQKSTKAYESASQGTYVVFRRVSENSDGNAFIHPGIEAHNLAEKAIAVTNIPLLVDKTTDDYLKQLGF